MLLDILSMALGVAGIVLSILGFRRKLGSFSGREPKARRNEKK